MSWISNTTNNLFLCSRTTKKENPLKLNECYVEAYRFTRSSEVLAKSTTLPVGCATRPNKPLPKPLAKPDAPPRTAPVTGFVTTPVTP